MHKLQRLAGRFARFFFPKLDTTGGTIAVARVGTAGLGFVIALTGLLNGITEPNTGGRAAEIQHQLHLTDGLLSLAWAGWPVGMFVSTLVAGRLLEKHGARTLLAWGAVFYWGAFAFIGLAPDAHWLFEVMFLVGLGNGLFDVAWTRFSTWYEARRQQEEGDAAGLANQWLTAFFSGGSLIGALVVGGVVAIGVPIAWHLLAAGALALTVTLWASTRLPNLGAEDGESDDEQTGSSGSTSRHSGPLPRALHRVSLLGICGIMPIGVGYVWSSVYLTRLGAEGFVATTGLIAYTASETVGGFTVGWLSKRRSATFRDPVKLTIGGGGVALAGVALIVLPARIDLAVVGFALLSFGLSPVLPAVQSAAARIAPKRKGAAIARNTMYTYTALVAGPAIVGPLSSVLGSDSPTPLRIALGGLLTALALGVIYLAPSLRPPPAAESA